MVRTGVITQDELSRGLGRHKFGRARDFISDAASTVAAGVKKAANWTSEKSDDLGDWIVGTETSGAGHDLRKKKKRTQGEQGCGRRAFHEPPTLLHQRVRRIHE
jgi:hypothetical protein